jgi:hypothetical protein
LTLVGFIASFFLPWYDDPDYYRIAYGSEGLFGFLISCIRWTTVASGVLTVVLVIIARRVEPKCATRDAYNENFGLK